MKKILGIIAFAALLAAAGLRADSATSMDTVTLKDGRVLRGEVVEESDAKLVLMLKGVKRSYSRDLVAKVSYGEGPASGAGDAAPPAPAMPAAREAAPGAPEPKGGLVADLSARYTVPESEVLWVRRQGIVDADLPVVFMIAAAARILPGAVVRFRLAGMSWRGIEAHYGLEPDYIYFEPGPWVPYAFYRPYYYGGWHGGWGRGYRRHWR